LYAQRSGNNTFLSYSPTIWRAICLPTYQMTNPNPLYWGSNMNANMLWTLLGWKESMNERKGSKIAITCKSTFWIKSLNPTKKNLPSKDFHHQNLECHQN
jgi:hypothetical protein